MSNQKKNFLLAIFTLSGFGLFITRVFADEQSDALSRLSGMVVYSASSTWGVITTLFFNPELWSIIAQALTLMIIIVIGVMFLPSIFK